MAQKGFIYKSRGSWFLKYRDDVIENGQIVRKQKCKKLALFATATAWRSISTA